MSRIKEGRALEAKAKRKAMKEKIAEGKAMLLRSEKAFKNAKTPVGIKRALKLKYEGIATIKNAKSLYSK